jgi:DUF971 family protein
MANAPTEIRLRRKSGVLSLAYADGSLYELSAEFLRVHSPSAEVRGHGAGQAVLQTGKRKVGIVSVEPIGNYAIRLAFDDRHDSGLYSWDYLYALCTRHDLLWQQYLQQLETAGASREPGSPSDSLSESVQVITIQPLSSEKS